MGVPVAPNNNNNNNKKRSNKVKVAPLILQDAHTLQGETDTEVLVVVPARSSSSSSSSSSNRTLRRVIFTYIAVLLTVALLVGTAGFITLAINKDKVQDAMSNATLTAANVAFREDGNMDSTLGLEFASAIPSYIPTFVRSMTCNLDVAVGEEGDAEIMPLGNIVLRSDMAQVADSANSVDYITLGLDNLNQETVVLLRNMYSRNETTALRLMGSCDIGVMFFPLYVVPIPYYTNDIPVELDMTPYFFPTEGDSSVALQDPIAINIYGIWPTTDAAVDIVEDFASTFYGYPMDYVLPTDSGNENDTTTTTTTSSTTMNEDDIVDEDTPLTLHVQVPFMKDLKFLSVSFPDTMLVLWQSRDNTEDMGIVSPIAGVTDVLGLGIAESTYTVIENGYAVREIDVHIRSIRTTMPNDPRPATALLTLAENDRSSSCMVDAGMWLAEFLLSERPSALMRTAGMDRSLLFYLLGYFRLEQSADLSATSSASMQSIIDSVFNKPTNEYYDHDYDYDYYDFDPEPLPAQAWDEEEEHEEHHHHEHEDEDEDEDDRRRRRELVEQASEQLIQLSLFDALTNVEELSVTLDGRVNFDDDTAHVEMGLVIADRTDDVFSVDFELLAQPNMNSATINLDFTNNDWIPDIPSSFESSTDVMWADDSSSFNLSVSTTGTSVQRGVTHNLDLSWDLTVDKDASCINIVGSGSDMTTQRTIPYSLLLDACASSVEGVTSVVVTNLYIREDPSNYLFNVDWDHMTISDDGVVSVAFQINGQWFGVTDVTGDIDFTDGASIEIYVDGEVLPDVTIVLDANVMDITNGFEVTITTLNANIFGLTVLQVTRWNLFRVVGTDNGFSVAVNAAAKSQIVGNVDVVLSMAVVESDISLDVDLDWSPLRPISFQMHAVVYDGESVAAISNHITLPFTVSAGDSLTRVHYSNFELSYGNVDFLDITGDMVLAIGDYINIAFEFDGDVQPVPQEVPAAWEITAWFNILSADTDFEIRVNYIRAGLNGDYEAGRYFHVPEAYVQLPAGEKRIEAAVDVRSNYFYDLDGDLTIQYTDTTNGGFTVTFPTWTLYQNRGSDDLSRYIINADTVLLTVGDDGYDFTVELTCSGWDYSSTGYVYVRSAGMFQDSSVARASIDDTALWTSIDNGYHHVGARVGAELSADDVCSCIENNPGSCAAENFNGVADSCNAGEESQWIRSFWYNLVLLDSVDFTVIENSMAIYSADTGVEDPGFSFTSPASSGSMVSPMSLIAYVLCALLAKMFWW